jgi:hypothetical protein
MFSIRLPGHAPRQLQPALAPAQYVLPDIPEVILESHGARVLLPSTAAQLKDQPRPRPTVYRAGVLLLPPEAARRNGFLWLNELLAPIGVQLIPVDPSGKPLFIVVELEPVDDFRPEPVDAWTALQLLRAAARPLRATALAAAEKDPGELTDEERRALLIVRVVAETTLDHLLIGSALDGAGSGGLIGTNTATNGSPDLGDLFNGAQPGTSGRIPVTVVLPTPQRPPVELPATRRPVVAVLDTGIATDPEHPWLTPLAKRVSNPEAAVVGDDAVVLVDPEFQDRIEQEAAQVSRPAIAGYADQPNIEEPLRGILATHAGHGTAIAGIIRQLAPSAQIYVMRVMHPYGFAHESDVCQALETIEIRVDRAMQGLPGGQMVDVVSLSLGYFHESPQEVAVTGKLATILDRLTRLGVTVVASAGNFSTSREFYPAALSRPFRDRADDRAPLISVGSLNPNGTTSMFSNEADWIDCYASGAAVVTTFPRFAGSLNPVVTIGRRTGYDRDDFSGMFGIWSGCSFSAPGIAACIANVLGAETGVHDHCVPDRVRAAGNAWTAVADDPIFRHPAEDGRQ